MAEIIIGIKTPLGETSIVRMSPEEIEAYAKEYLLHGETTFEAYCCLKALLDSDLLIERHEEQRMWFEERERELRTRFIFGGGSSLWDRIGDRSFRYRRHDETL